MTFQEFLLENIPHTGEYIVGYDENTGTEIRIPIGNLAEKGAAGISIDIQFSANGTDTWHYPSIEDDKYMRVRKGTEAWSAAFKIAGEKGDSGISAYQVWLAAGNEGTEDDFLNSFKGANGASAYSVWLAVGNEGTVEDFLNSIKGATGASAYSVWLAAGNEGTEDDFLNSIKGATGASSYVHIRWGTSATPSQLLTTPADYIGIYSGTSATAPTSYTGYTWYKVKGEPGETTASEVGLPDNGEWGDLLRIDMDGKPYWLKGTNYYLNIHEEVIGLASPAKRTIIGHDGGGDIAIHVNGAMYQIYEDFEIIVFNSASHSKMVTVIPSGDFYFKDDRNAVELHSNNFLEILFRPIFEPDMGIFTVLITMGFKGLDY